jgi:peptidoglycan hydrolase-like protein with peptidoglycan-binding domain
MAEMRKSQSGKLLRKGSRGDDVRKLQQDLARLGFDLKADGIFGDDTESAVIQLQTMFGYDVDALVGDGTKALIQAQLGYGWNAKAPNAAELALRSQGKGTTASATSKAPPTTSSASPGQWTPQMPPVGKPGGAGVPGKTAPANPSLPSKPAPQKPAPQRGGLPKAPWPWNR